MVFVEFDVQVDVIFVLCFVEVDLVIVLFLMVVLQVVWMDFVSCVMLIDVLYFDQLGLCLVCGMYLVVSVVWVGGQYQGYCFFQCGLCMIEWYMVCIKCLYCDLMKGIVYYGIEGGSEVIKVELCDECKIYCKIGYQEKDYEFELLVDDFVSFMFDLLMNEVGYQCSLLNLLLWLDVLCEVD